MLPPLVAMKNQKLLEDIERSRVLDTFDVTPELARHVGRVASAD
jgi:hypothetical protein